MLAKKEIRWLWIGILVVYLVSCFQEPTTPAIDAVDTVAISASLSPQNTTTQIAVTAKSTSPTLTITHTLEPPTKTSLPTKTITLTPIPWPTSESFFDRARVTFIDIAGFLITVGDKKILIDTLYDVNNPSFDPPREVIQRAVNADPPFDQIDLLIATHGHPDHFSADLVRDHLRNNEKAVFVSSSDTVRQISRLGNQFDERMIPVDLEPGESLHLSINGIELDCLYINHGDVPILNLGMVITVDDYTFFHSGDMNVDSSWGEYVSLGDLQGYGLPHKEIDLAILPNHIFSVNEYIPLIEDGIQARYVSPMHYPYRHPPTGIEENFPNVVIFKDVLENWVVPLDD